MGKLCKKEKRDFGRVTLGASLVSAVLWIAAGSVGVYTGDYFSYIIIALLAMLAMGVALQSAKLEGFEVAHKRTKKGGRK